MIPSDERFEPGQTGRIALEHYNRYYFVIHQMDCKEKVIIDLASGEGYGTDILAKHAAMVYGIDNCAEAIRHAQSKYKRDNLIFITGDAACIPLPDQTADIFVSFETIEHVENQEGMMKEIKRVLKPGGTLVISSPDRYQYSVISGSENDFHIKELFQEEFKDLLGRFFKNCMYFSQRIFTGSLIVLDENTGGYSKPLIINKEGAANDWIPMYNLAIATDNPDLTPKYPLIGYKETEYIISQNDLERERNNVYLTKSYKLGNFFVRPLKLFKRFLMNHLKL